MAAVGTGTTAGLTETDAEGERTVDKISKKGQGSSHTSQAKRLQQLLNQSEREIRQISTKVNLL